jgi:putative transposase
MDTASNHRKRIRHFDDAGHVHELTFSCYSRMQLLLNDEWKKMLSQSIDRAMERHQYRLVAFVFMPEHVHLLVFRLEGTSEVADLLKAIKRPFSYRVKQELLKSNDPLLDRLTVHQRRGVRTFRFWQEGPGYDRNLTHSATAMAAIEYIHNNPVRRELVTSVAEWEWSSARFYLDDPPRQ